MPLCFAAGEEAWCSVCDSVGDLSGLLYCTGCGQHYHDACLEISATPLQRSGWQCPECKVCQTCRYVLMLLASLRQVDVMNLYLYWCSHRLCDFFHTGNQERIRRCWFATLATRATTPSVYCQPWTLCPLIHGSAK